MERLTGIKPTLGFSGKTEGQTERVLLLLWNKVPYLEGCKRTLFVHRAKG